MTDGFKKLVNKEVKDLNRREKLNEEESDVKPEKIEKARLITDRKKGNYITDNIDETPNVQ
jgi:hypothetical protein